MAPFYPYGRRDSEAAAASAGSAAQQVDCQASCCQQQVVEAQDQEADSGRGHPIAGLVDLRWCRLVDMPVDAHLVARAHLPGWAAHS